MLNLTEMIQNCSPKVGEVLFISVDGHSGSGKSTLAEQLSKKLGAGIIHTDDFSGWENPLDWWPDVIGKVFTPIQAGAKLLNYDRADCWPEHPREAMVNQVVTPIMILEGVSSSRKEFNDYISLRIFVQTPKNVCLARGIERDSKTNNNLEEITKIWEDWFTEEDKYFAHDNPKDKADIIIDGTKPFTDQLTF